MKAEFSEFSYGFALAFEIMNALYPTASGVPFFPSLQQEASLGYDANFTAAGWPLFLQFKLADYMTRRAKYSSEYGGPFFRVAVHRRKDSDQHNLLKSLALREPEVYYVAPAFRRQRDFNRFFVNDEIFTNTVFIPLEVLPLLTDDKRHYITYDASSTRIGFRWHSDGGEYFQHPITGREWVEHLRRLMERPRELGLQFLYELRNILVQIINDHTLQPELLSEDSLMIQVDQLSSLIREVRNLLATYFGVVLIFLRPPL